MPPLDLRTGPVARARSGRRRPRTQRPAFVGAHGVAVKPSRPAPKPRPAPRPAPRPTPRQAAAAITIKRVQARDYERRAKREHAHARAQVMRDLGGDRPYTDVERELVARFKGERDPTPFASRAAYQAATKERFPSRAAYHAAQPSKAYAKALAGARAARAARPMTREQFKANPRAAISKAIRTQGLASQTTGALGLYKATAAPATKALEQLDRSSRAVNAALLHDVKQFQKHGPLGLVGHGSLKAAERGASLKGERVSGADVLKQAGVKNKTLRSALGFPLEVAIDPLTWTTGGTISVARKAALKEAGAAGKAARTEARGYGATRKQARRSGQRARYSVTSRPLPTAGRAGERGIRIRFAGTEIPGIHRGTRVAARVTRKAGARAPAPVRRRVAAVAGHTRKITSGLHGGVRPVGQTRGTRTQSRQIKREMRATEEAHGRAASGRAKTLERLTTLDERNLIRGAIERNDIESLRGKAKPLPHRVPRRGRVLANDPDRLYKLAKQMGSDWAERRATLHELGVPIGHVGEKPAVRIPEVSADVGAAQKTLARTRRQQARAEREALEQAKPGALPGKLTPAQTTRAERLTARAQERKAAALKQFRDSTRNARAASNPSVAARFRKRASAARGRASRAQAEIDHWGAVAGRQTRPTRRVLTPVSEEVLGVASRAAPARATIPVGAAQVRGARAALAETKVAAKTQRREQRAAQREAAAQALEPKGYYPRIPHARLERLRKVEGLEDLLAAKPTPKRGGTGSVKRPRGPQTQRRGGLGRVRIDLLKERAAAGGKQGQRAQEYLERLSEDLPLIYESYGRAAGRTQARAEANRKLARTGRPVEQGAPVRYDEAHERVYRRDGADLKELDPADPRTAAELRRIEAGNARGEQYVVLDRALADDVLDTGKATFSHEGIDAWDRLWGKWKGFTLGTPGYLVRNALSDAFASYQEQGAARLAANYVRGQGVLRNRGRNERAYNWFQDQHPGRDKTVNINGTDVPRSMLALEAEAAGAIGQGRVAELREQAEAGRLTGGGKLSRGGPTGESTWRRTVRHVEDSARLATYIGFRRRGFTAPQAADKVAAVHFDYGDLTRFEKEVSRRLMPFYTFTSRNIPRQAALLARRPGTFATLQKAREAGREYAELPVDFVEQLNPYDARQLGVPVKLGKDTYVLSFGGAFSDLNDVVPDNLSVSKDPTKFVESLAKLPVTTITNRGIELLGPWKAVGELVKNYSLFYNEPISKEGNRLVAAPAPIGMLADALSAKGRKQLGFVQELDKRTNTKHWAWGARLDYAVKAALPGLAGVALKQSYAPKVPRPVSVGSALSGLRLAPYQPDEAAASRIYDQRELVNNRLHDLNEQGVYKANATPEYRKLLAQSSAIEKQLSDVNKRRLKFHPSTGGGTRKSTGNRPLGGSLGGGGGGVNQPLGGSL